MKARALVPAVLGLAAGFGLAGCAYEDPATGAKATYALHALHSEIDAPVPVVYAAALKAADHLDLNVGRAVERIQRETATRKNPAPISFLKSTLFVR